MQKSNIDGKEIFHYSAQKPKNSRLIDMDEFVSEFKEDGEHQNDD